MSLNVTVPIGTLICAPGRTRLLASSTSGATSHSGVAESRVGHTWSCPVVPTWLPSQNSVLPFSGVKSAERRVGESTQAWAKERRARGGWTDLRERGWC